MKGLQLANWKRRPNAEYIKKSTVDGKAGYALRPAAYAAAYKHLLAGHPKHRGLAMLFNITTTAVKALLERDEALQSVCVAVESELYREISEELREHTRKGSFQSTKFRAAQLGYKDGNTPKESAPLLSINIHTPPIMSDAQFQQIRDEGAQKILDITPEKK